MRNTFYTSEKVSIKASEGIVEKLETDLDELVTGKASEEEALEYCILLAKQAVMLNPEKHMLFWPVRTDSGMPADARVDFIYVPTYAACGIIMYSMLHYKSVAEFKPIIKTLQYGLNGCMGREFMGHGYEAMEGFHHAMHIFDISQAEEFTRKFPGINKRFNRMLEQAVEYRKNLSVD